MNSAVRIHGETNRRENVPMPDWNRQARNRDVRLERAAHLTSTKLVPATEAGAAESGAGAG